MNFVWVAKDGAEGVATKITKYWGKCQTEGSSGHLWRVAEGRAMQVVGRE